MAHKVSVISVLLLFGAINLLRADESAGGLTEESLANGINQFGCNLLNGLYKDTPAEENILVSPVNAYAALALLHLGAGEKTRKELSAIMKVPESVTNSTEVHERLHSVLSLLSPKPTNETEKWGTFHETKLANGIFMQKDFPIKDGYLELAKKYYDSLAQNIDFQGKAQEATDIINNWISNSTKGRIDKFYDKPLSADTVAVLTSALYFNAKWRDTFSPEETKIEKFNTGSTEIEVHTMHQDHLMYHSSDDTLHYDSVSLLYSGKQHEMKIYLQHTEHGDHGSLAHLFHNLAQQNFAPNTTSILYRQVDLKLPKMKFSWKNSVVNALKLEPIFNAVDLEEMTPSKNVKVSNMIQATELEVDEKGTIASAATALEVSLMSALIPDKASPIQFHVNRPFLMTITHRPTRTILFAGIIRKPTK